MKKQVLLIGGSYFLGRVFTMLYAKQTDWELTLLNRGRYSMACYGVKELRCNRGDPDALKSIPTGRYDAIIDFCAYHPGEIPLLLEHLPVKCDRYVFISTCDVYRRDNQPEKTETAPLEDRLLAGENGDYIRGKILLEQELGRVCAQRGILPTILRPAAIYGPYNYAPREGMLVQRVAQGLPLHIPRDESGRFQLVYVADVARAIGLAVENHQTASQTFNLCAPRQLNYRELFELLTAGLPQPPQVELCDYAYTTMHPDEFPFSVTGAESQSYDGSLACRELGFAYTPEEEGLRKTASAFWQVYHGAGSTS